jgi:hypothetical protein
MVVCFMMMATFVLAEPGVSNMVSIGTVLDTSTGLVWLKNANCFGQLRWSEAMSSAASLKYGMCCLTDGSTAGQWQLPTKVELMNRQKNRKGFDNVKASYYWTSSSKYPPPEVGDTSEEFIPRRWLRSKSRGELLTTLTASFAGNRVHCNIEIWRMFA